MRNLVEATPFQWGLLSATLAGMVLCAYLAARSIGLGVDLSVAAAVMLSAIAGYLAGRRTA